MDYHPSRTSPSIGSQVRTAAATGDLLLCHGGLLPRSLFGEVSRHGAIAPAGSPNRYGVLAESEQAPSGAELRA